jgi:hypothetical protein
LRARTGIVDVVAAWTLLAVVATEVFVTYARLPVQELYQVRNTGAGTGGARLLAFIGFPASLVAIAVLGLVSARIHRRTAVLSALAGGALTAAIVWPGALGEAGLETQPARLLAFAGVMLSLGLTTLAERAVGLGAVGREPFDRVRVVLAAILLFGALPWMAADLGFSLDRVPVLNAIFQTDILLRQPGQPLLPAVHDGHHHGMDGVLLALTAMLLSRSLHFVTRPRLRLATGAYLAVVFVYGLTNAVQDFTTEQVVKRGWTTHSIPKMVVPSIRPAWAVVIVLIACVVIIWRARSRGPVHEGPPGRSAIRSRR